MVKDPDLEQDEVIHSYGILIGAISDRESWHAHGVDEFAILRQSIADYGLEDEEVRNLDKQWIENLRPFIDDFLVNFKNGFSYLVPEVVDEEDLNNWWFRIDDIAKGTMDVEELPEYLRDAAGRYLSAATK